MSDYYFMLHRLRDFDLITDEQLAEAEAEYEREWTEYEDRRDAFMVEWKTIRRGKPWWKRWLISPHDWLGDWHKQEYGDA